VEGANLHFTLIKLAAWLLYEFLEVHPFADGNGRMARVLVSNILAYFYPVPVPILSEEVADSRAAYIY